MIKRNRKNRAILAISAAVALSGLQAVAVHANTYAWSGTTNGNMTGNITNWTPNGTPGASDIAEWNSATYTTAPSLNASMTIGELWLAATSTGNLAMGNTTNTLTLNGLSGIGIQQDSGAGNFTISPKVVLGGNQTWINNSVGNVTDGTLNIGTNVLTINGSGNFSLGTTGQTYLTGTTGSLVLAGTGTTTLYGANYTGGVWIQSGTGYAFTSTSFGTGNVTLGNSSGSSNATLEAYGNLNNNITVAAGSTGNLTIWGVNGQTPILSGNIALNNNLIVYNSNHPLTLSGNITGNGNITFGETGGTGTYYVTGATNSTTYTGNTSILPGTLNFVSGELGTGNISFGGGTLQYATGNSLDISGRFANSTSPISIDVNGNQVAFSTAIASSNTGGLTLTSSTAGGILTLNAANAYSGNTTVTTGTLKDGITNGVPSGVNLTVAAAGTFDLNGNSQTLGLVTATGGCVITNSGSGTPTLTIGNGSTGTGNFTGAMNLIWNQGGSPATTVTNVGITGNVTINQQGSASTAQITNLNNAGTFTSTGSGTSATNISTAGSNVTALTATSTTSTLTVTNLAVNSGGTTLTNSQSTKVFTETNAVTGTGNLTLDNNGTLASGITLTGGGNFIGNLTNAGSGSGSATVTGALGTNVQGVFQTSPTSTLAINGINLFAGNLTIINGIVSSSSATTPFGSGAGSIVIGNTTPANSNAAELLYSGTSTTVSNPLVVNAGSSGTLSIQGSTGNNTFTGPMTLNNNLTLAQVTAAKMTTLSGQITGSGNIAVGTGGSATGIVALTGSNSSSYTGNTTINLGVLDFANGSLGTGYVNFGGNSTLQWAAGNTQDISGQLLPIASNTVGTLDLLTNAVTFATTNGLTGSGNYTKLAASSGILTLNAANNLAGTYTAATTGGTTLLKNANALGNATVSLLTGTTTGGISFDSSVGGNFTIGALTGAGTLNLQDNATNPVTLTVGNNNTAPAAYTAAITGNGSIIEIGSGTLTLGGNSTFSGGFTLSSGTVKINGGSTFTQLGNGTLTLAGGDVTDGGTTALPNLLNITGSILFDSAASNSMNFTGGGNISGNPVLTFSNPNGVKFQTNPITLLSDVTFAGYVAGTALVNFSGGLTTLADRTITFNNSSANGATVSGLLTLGGNLTLTTTIGNSAGGVFSGGIALGAGNRTISGNAAFNISGNLSATNPGESLTLTGTNTAVGKQSIGPVNVGANNPTIIVNMPSGLVQFNSTGGVGNYAGNTILTAGNLQLGSNGNTSAGPLGVGNLSLNGGELSSSGSARTIFNPLTLDANTQFGDATYAGAIVLDGPFALDGNYTITVSGSSMIATIGGNIANGTAGTNLIKAGPGTMVLLGNNTYTGTTTISAGIVQVGNATSGFDGVVPSASIVNNGNLAYNLFGNQTYAGVISGGGNLTVSGNAASVFTLSNANTFSGNTAGITGTLDLQNSLALQNSTVIPTSTGNITFDPAVATHAFIFAGLSGAGNLSLNDGTNAVALSVGNNNGNSTYTGVLSGNGSLTKIGTGTLAVNGIPTLTGGINVYNGTLSSTIQLGTTSVMSIGDPNGATDGNPSATFISTANSGVSTNYVINAGSSGTLSIIFGTGPTTSWSTSGTFSVYNNLTLDNQDTGHNMNLSGAVTEYGTTPLTITKGPSSASTALNGSLTLSTGGLTLANIGSGTITQAGGLGGTGNLTLSANSTGPISITSASINNAGTITNNGTGNGTVTLSGAVGSSVTGITQNTPTSLLSFGGNNSAYTAGIVIKNGAVDGTAASALGNSASVITLGDASTTSTGATLEGSNNLTSSSPINVIANSNGGVLTITNDTNGHTVALGGSITLNSTGVTVQAMAGGIGTVTLSGNLTSSDSSGGDNLTIINGSTTASTNNSINFSGANNNPSGNITNTGSGSGRTIFNSNLGAAVTGVIENSATSQLTLAGTASAYAGNLTINAGIADMTNPLSLGTGSIILGNSSSSADATVQLHANVLANPIIAVAGCTGILTIGNDGGNGGEFTGNLTLNNNVELRETGNSSDFIYKANINGGYNITTDAATNGGAVILWAHNTGFTGNITVNSGALKPDSLQILVAANSLAVNSGATFDINNIPETIPGLNNVAGVGGTVTNSGTSVQSLTLGGNGTYSFAGTITATTPANLALAVSLTGNGTQTLTGSNTYAGGTTITSGSLAVANASGSATGAGTVIVTGGILGGNGTMAPTGTSGTLISLAAGATLSPSLGAATTTTLNANVSSSASAAALDIAGGAIFSYNFAAPGTSDSLAVTGNVTLESGTDVLNINQLSGFGLGNYTLISAGNLTDNASGWTLPSSGNYTYAVTSTATTLLLNVTPNSGPVTVTWNGNVSGSWDTVTANWQGSALFAGNDTVVFDDTAAGPNFTVDLGGATFTPGNVTVNNSSNAYSIGNGTIGGNATLTKNGNNTLTLTGNNTYSGGTTVNAGTLDVASATNGLLSGSTVTNYANLQFDGAQALATITGNGTTTVSGTGSLAVTSFTQSNLVNNGAFTLNGTGTVSTAISGIGNLTVSSTGVLTAASFAQTALVNNGTVQINGTGTIGQLTGTGNLTIGTGSSNNTVQLTSNALPNSFIHTQQSVTISSGSTLDITNNTLFLNYGSGSNPLAAVQAAVASGAIMSSTAALGNPNQYAVGYADSTEVGSIPSNNVEVMFTLGGDANLDGVVNFNDYSVLQNAYNQTGRDWAQGDFNNDGSVNFNDYSILQNNYGQTLAGIVSGSAIIKGAKSLTKTSGSSTIIGAALAANGLTKISSSIAPAVAPTVTYILSVNDDGTGHYSAGHYAVYASDSTNNGGLASYDISLAGTKTLTNYSPKGIYDDGTGCGNDDEIGFVSLRTANNASPATASQDTAGYASGAEVILVYRFGQTAGNLAADAAPGSTGGFQVVQAVYGTPLELIKGSFSSGTPSFTSTGTDTGNVFLTTTGYGTEAPTLAFSTVTVASGVAHSALLTITASGSASPSYIGTSNPGGQTSSSTITVVNTGVGYYIPGLLNGINAGNATKGAAKISGFSGTDAEIIAVAISVTDAGNATLHTPSAQELADIITDLNASPSLPGGATVTVEAYNGTTAGTLQYDNPAAFALLNTVESTYGGQTLKLAVLVNGVTPAGTETFGLNFASESVDGITAVDVTDIAVVPEPASMSLLLLGGLPLLVRRRRRRV